MLNEFIEEIEINFNKTIDILKIEYSKINANKVNLNLLNTVKIKYYDEIYTLDQISVINIEDYNSVIIKPFDKKNISSISKEIVNLNLDLNPFTHGDIIKVIFPKMTMERREMFAKKIKKTAEDSKIAIRNIRKNYIQKVKNISKEKKISKDDEKIILNKTETITTKYIEKIEEMTNKKITDILKI